jgi:cytoskeleton protein RodZ
VGAFGNKFRKEREKRGFSLDDVSSVTKIGSRMLQAIEDERFDRLPGGVFNKGFIRAYAKHLGLNDEEAITDYLECLREAQIGANAVPEPQKTIPGAAAATPRKIEAKAPAYAKPRIAPKPQASPSRPQTGSQQDELANLQLPIAEHVRPKRNLNSTGWGAPSWRLPALIVAVVLLGIFLWSRHHGVRNDGASSAHAAPSSITASPAILASASDSSAINHPGASAPASVATSHLPAQHSSPASSAPGSSSPSVAAPSATATTATTTTRQSSALQSMNASSPNSAPTAQPPVKPQATFTLVIRAAQNSWISVSADGQPASEETLIAPAHTSVRASREIVVRAGNAGGVSFLLNGKEIPAQGNDAEVKTIIFDSTGIKPPATTQTSGPTP